MSVSCFEVSVFAILLFSLNISGASASLEIPVDEHQRRSLHRQVLSAGGNATTDPLQCNGIRNRKEFRDLTPRELSQWQRAVLKLNEVDNSGFSQWDRLVILHASFVTEAHGGSYFLPWHRFFLLQLENALRRIQPGLALPYWDWGHDAADPALSPVWGRKVAGRAVRGRPIGNGPFRSLQVRFMQPHLVVRDFASGVSGAIPPIHDTDTLNRIKNLIDYGAFANALELCHNFVHADIGGDMAFTMLSPNDPVFYLHHAFVDFVWFQRQKVKGINDFGGTHTFGFFDYPASPDWELVAFNKTVREAFNISCVNYVPPRFKNRAPVGSNVTARAIPNPCEQPSIASGLSMDSQRCMEGESVLVNLTV